MTGCCNAEFACVPNLKDTACSTGALNHLQGTILYSSPAGEGMRLEYPFGPFITDPFYSLFIGFVLRFCLTRTPGLRNHGWECVRSQSKLHRKSRQIAIWLCHCPDCMHIYSIWNQIIGCLNCQYSCYHIFIVVH